MNKDSFISTKLFERPYILEKRGTIMGLLSDVFPEDKALVYQYLMAYDQGLVEKILNNSTSRDQLKYQLISSFEVNSGYDKDTAKNVIETWLSWLSPGVINAYKGFKEKPPEPIHLKKEPMPEPSAGIETKGLMHGDIYFPCAIGKAGTGFVIRGINSNGKCSSKDESVFAILYNYLLRSRTINEISDLPKYIERRKSTDLNYDPDYRTVYRLMVTVLTLVKHGYDRQGRLEFSYDGQEDELHLAIDCVNDYLTVFSKIAKIRNAPQITYLRSQRLRVSMNDTGAHIFIGNFASASNARPFWFAQNIIYRIDDSVKEPLIRILREMSPYEKFNPGQFEALSNMINCRAHSICIMPTGSGKSLIYYIMAILQPNVMFVVSPTDILIEDQLNNLLITHKFDNVKKAECINGNTFANYPLDSHLIYLTPEVFQNRDLLKEFVVWNQRKKISAIVLDEVHCLSNWSHDFRPEYLMLSRQLNEFLDKTYFKGFTATANYSVMKDIGRQLGISNEAIFSPVELKKENLRFYFKSCASEDLMVENVSQCLKKAIKTGKKTLVFTKSDITSKKLRDRLEEEVRYDTIVYSEDDLIAYRSFVNNECKVLITTDELGIGINLSDIQNVVHYGLPISKGEYVQQIGRAGRNGEKAYSYVFYLECNSNNVDDVFLHRKVSTTSIISALSTNISDNDYVEAYRKLLVEVASFEDFSKALRNVFMVVNRINKFTEIEFEVDTMPRTKRCLYILFVVGYLTNWSVCDKKKIGVYANPKKEDLSVIKSVFREYLFNVGENKKIASAVGTAKDMYELLDLYLDWYFNYFMYFHKEQFLEMLAFFESYASQKENANFSRAIAEKLAGYFSLQMLEITEDEAKYANLSYKQITEAVNSGIEYSTVSNIEKLNQNKYNAKFDWLIFIHELLKEENYEHDRFERIAESIAENEVIDWCDSISMFYGELSDEGRLDMFSIIEAVAREHDRYEVCLDSIYRSYPKDIVYYGVLAERTNTLLLERK